MKNLISFILIFFFLNANCQNEKVNLNIPTISNGLSNDEFNYACVEYKKMMQTTAYSNNETKTKLYAEKMNEAFSSKDFSVELLKDKNIFFSWLEKNIEKTKFKNIDEAKEFIKDVEDTTEKLINENKKLHDLIEKATVEQRLKIFQPKFEKDRKEVLGY